MRNKRDFAVVVVTDFMEAARRVVYGAGALQACAETLGLSHQTLSKQLNEEEGTQLGVRKLMSIESFMDTDAFAECAASRRGGVFLKFPDPDMGGAPELVRGYAKLVGEFADTSRALSDGMADGQLSAAEIDRVEKELNDVYVAGAGLVAAARARLERKP